MPGIFRPTRAVVPGTRRAIALGVPGRVADARLTLASAWAPLIAEPGTFVLTGGDATLVRGYTLVASGASFALTGNDAALTAQRRLTAAAGSFALTGNAAGLAHGYLMPASAGAFVLTGIAAGLSAQRRLAAVAGAFTLTGIAAALRAQRLLPTSTGVYTLAGVAASLRAQRRLTAAPGSYAWTGIAAGLRAQRQISVAPGSFALTGIAASLRAGRRLIVDAGAFVLTGLAAGLEHGTGLHDFVLTTSAGAFVLVGHDVGLVLVGAPPGPPVPEFDVEDIAARFRQRVAVSGFDPAPIANVDALVREVLRVFPRRSTLALIPSLRSTRGDELVFALGYAAGLFVEPGILTSRERILATGRAVVWPPSPFLAVDAGATPTSAEAAALAAGDVDFLAPVIDRRAELDQPPPPEPTELAAALETIELWKSTGTGRRTTLSTSTRGSIAGGVAYALAARTRAGIVEGHGASEDAATIDLAAKLRELYVFRGESWSRV